MAQAARRRYATYGSQAAERQARPTGRPQVRVIPGRRGENPALRGISQQASTVFKVVIAALAVIALVSLCRVALSAATVANLEQVQTLETRLDAARASGNELEIRHSMLASSSRIEDKARKLGMVQASKTTYLTVDLPSAGKTAASSGK